MLMSGRGRVAKLHYLDGTFRLLSDGDHVVARWTSTGTHLGDLQGIAPTGRRITSTGITIARFVNGKIAEEWANWDTLGLMRQLGVVK